MGTTAFTSKKALLLRRVYGSKNLLFRGRDSVLRRSDGLRRIAGRVFAGVQLCRKFVFQSTILGGELKRGDHSINRSIRWWVLEYQLIRQHTGGTATGPDRTAERRIIRRSNQQPTVRGLRWWRVLDGLRLEPNSL
jgi:hypothetical protein